MCVCVCIERERERDMTQNEVAETWSNNFQ